MTGTDARPLAVCIAGAGRMGSAIAGLVEAADDLQLAGIWQRGGDLDAIAGSCDVIVDFSLPEATATVIAAALQHSVPVVCGVSGLGAGQQRDLDAAATDIAILYDRNMSLGIAVLDSAVRQAAVALGPGFAVRIHETHHVHKQDAPSGTALKLGETVAAAVGIEAGSISYESERRGEVPGDHEVEFSSATERLSFAHSVTTRQVFAEGAVTAARWIVNQAAGRYSMHDVLGTGG